MVGRVPLAQREVPSRSGGGREKEGKGGRRPREGLRRNGNHVCADRRQCNRRDDEGEDGAYHGCDDGPSARHRRIAEPVAGRKRPQAVDPCPRRFRPDLLGVSAQDRAGGLRQTRNRLLDDRVLDSTGLRFDRLRRIPRDKRRWIEVGFGLTGGGLEITKLDDRTHEPEATHRFRAGPQSVEFAIEWPLPGAADWTGVPCENSPWAVSPDQLFRIADDSGLSCDEWLGQQVVLFDGKGISLKEMIRTVVNFEGAHSINVGRLATVEGEKPSRATANPAPHILNAITFCGIRYADLIVIECALYLCRKLLKEDSIERPSGEVYLLKPGVACSPDQAESPRPDWVNYQGGMMISFSGAPSSRVIRHEIKAVR